ncbi:enoyl-CoA hydratase/isomerase family protein [Phaeovulum sp. W22_SRMD_FR3]|uniref:enoyl-CoA hydratase/isomerase family protein n=1 Tax=Phaeovulum sp. W22_SRMD_FR3 TaxID=3240274 RepID=UPI003F9EA17A
MINVTKTPGLWTVQLDRPDKANALTSAMLETLIDAFTAAKQAQINALILTGSGKVFSAGADLAEAHAGLATSDLWERLSGAVADLPALTIAALNGTVAGGALGMVLACDLRLCVPQANFFYPVMKLGFLPQPSDARRMARLIGPARTKWILMGGQKITADTARDWGLVEAIAAAQDLEAQARGLAEAAMAAQPALVAGIKQLVP